MVLQQITANTIILLISITNIIIQVILLGIRIMGNTMNTLEDNFQMAVLLTHSILLRIKRRKKLLKRRIQMDITLKTNQSKNKSLKQQRKIVIRKQRISTKLMRIQKMMNLAQLFLPRYKRRLNHQSKQFSKKVKQKKMYRIRWRKEKRRNRIKESKKKMKFKKMIPRIVLKNHQNRVKSQMKRKHQ